MDSEVENVNKIETSKLILIISYIVGLLLTAIVVMCTIAGIECGNITTICGAAWLEISASNVFYYTMCKRLNVPKVVMYIYKDLPDELKEQVDINALLGTLMN